MTSSLTSRVCCYVPISCPSQRRRAHGNHVIVQCPQVKSDFMQGKALKAYHKCSRYFHDDVLVLPLRCLADDQAKPGDELEASTSPSKRPSKGIEAPPHVNPAVTDPEGLAAHIKYHAKYSPSFNPMHFEAKQAYFAAAQSVKDKIIHRWNKTFKHFQTSNAKAVHYLSMEFLQGRALTNAIGNLDLYNEYVEALRQLGYAYDDVAEQEPDAALGNGGLGRLASCFLDSLATLNYPAWGYGLRFKYGLFRQEIDKDGQHEVVETWLEMGYPWEIARHDICYPINFFGKTLKTHAGKTEWVAGENVEAVAYDVPIPGYKTKNTICLRLWSTKVGPKNFDLAAFNAGDYDKAASLRNNAQRICHVLYPGDATMDGKLLRLKQQYTLCSASIQDMVARFKEWSGSKVNFHNFPSKVAIQMNDTHPTLCIPELMRIFVDYEGLEWDQAWDITRATVAYTNHTVLPEALEKWPLPLLQKLLPRHVEIIEKIDETFIKSLANKVSLGELDGMVARLRILENVEISDSLRKELLSDKKSKLENSTNPKRVSSGKENIDVKAKAKTDPWKPEVLVRMANLSVIAGHKVNGVAAIHTEIVKNEVFKDFYKMWPEKFNNKTNGVTPRRWLAYCNLELSDIITKWLGSRDWVLHTELLIGLRKHAANQDFLKEWRLAKQARKTLLASFIKEKTGYVVNPNSMFDVQIKRIHEYKRQLMNIMGVIYRYKKMKEMGAKEREAKYVPRVCIFGGKAFATYLQAKRIVRLITDVAALVNKDSAIGDLLKVIFIPDYNVSVAEKLIPASDLSQHISTAGMEASGTSNMKFAMNGCLTIGTLDGANVEIRKEVGEENFFLFGATVDQIQGLRAERAAGKFIPWKGFEEVKKWIRSGVLGNYDYSPLLESLEGNEGYGKGDYFLVGKDFPSYIECQEKVDQAYKDQERWTRMSIFNTSGSAKFSSDRTIHEYAKEIWGVRPNPVP